VENTKNVRDSVQQVMQEMGFHVMAAATEDEAMSSPSNIARISSSSTNTNR
jgi:hypothetical protein